MASKSKPRKAINAFNQFEEKLRKYLNIDNNPDFIAALREMISDVVSRDVIKGTAKKYKLSDADTERLIEMNAKWSDLNKLMREIGGGKSIDNNLSEVLVKFRDLQTLPSKTGNLLGFRLSARNLHLLGDIKSGEVGYESKKILDENLKEIAGYVEVLKELQQSRPLCEGIIEVCINNPHMDTAEAKNLIDLFRDLANKEHPSRSISREEFLNKHGKKYQISTVQFNRAWEASQEYLISVAMQPYRGKKEEQLRGELGDLLKQLDQKDGNVTFQDYLKAQQTVKALRLLDGKHIKKLFGENGKEIRRGFEKQFRGITKAREKKIESGDINKAQFISIIQYNAIKSIDEGNKIFEAAHKITTEFTLTPPASVKELENKINSLSSEMTSKESEMIRIIGSSEGNNIPDEVRKKLTNLNKEIENDLSELKSLKEKFDAAVENAKNSIPEAPPPPKATVDTATTASSTATAASNISVASSPSIRLEKQSVETSITVLAAEFKNRFEQMKANCDQLGNLPKDRKKVEAIYNTFNNMEMNNNNYEILIKAVEKVNAEFGKRLGENAAVYADVKPAPPVSPPPSATTSKPAISAGSSKVAKVSAMRDAANRTLTLKKSTHVMPKIAATLEFQNLLNEARAIININQIKLDPLGKEFEDLKLRFFDLNMQIKNEFDGNAGQLKQFIEGLKKIENELSERLNQATAKIVPPPSSDPPPPPSGKTKVNAATSSVDSLQEKIKEVQQNQRDLENYKRDMKEDFPVPDWELNPLNQRVKALIDGLVHEPTKEATTILNDYKGLFERVEEKLKREDAKLFFENDAIPVQIAPASTYSASANVSKQRDLPLYNDAKDMLIDCGYNPYEILKITSDKLIDKSDKEKNSIIEEAFDRAMKTTGNKEFVKAAYAVLRDESARQLQAFSPPFNSTPVSNVSIDHHMPVLKSILNDFEARNAYGILELDPNNLSDQKVKKAYEDRQNPLPTGISREVLDAAYEVLKNSETREEYNRQIEPTAPGCGRK